jgi:hypothetical protein
VFSHLDDDEAGTGGLGRGKVNARLVVRDVEALDGREGTLGEAQKGGEIRLHFHSRYLISRDDELDRLSGSGRRGGAKRKAL